MKIAPACNNLNAHPILKKISERVKFITVPSMDN